MSDHAPLPAPIPQRESLISLAADSLRAHLRGGHWRDRLPSERDLCTHLQVSRPTVRAALQILEQQGVIELAGRMRRPAASMRRRTNAAPRSRVIRILTPWPLQKMPQSGLLTLDLVRERLASIGFATDTHTDPRCFSRRPARALEKLLHGRPAAAWIVWGSKEPMQHWFVQQHVPVAIVGSCRAEIPLPSIDLDYRATCRHAADVLWRKGHRRIALVVQQDAFGGDIDSEQAFRAAVADHGEAELRILRHDGTPTHVCTLLDRTLRGPSAPTAYFVVRAAHALTVLTHLLRRRLAIPQEVAVLSRDDEGYFDHTSPVISRYAVKADQVARKLCKVVRELAEGGSVAAHPTRLIPALVRGETI